MGRLHRQLALALVFSFGCEGKEDGYEGLSNVEACQAYDAYVAACNQDEPRRDLDCDWYEDPRYDVCDMVAVYRCREEALGACVDGGFPDIDFNTLDNCRDFNKDCRLPLRDEEEGRSTQMTQRR